MNNPRDLFDLPPLPPYSGLPDDFTIPSTWKFLGTASVAGIAITAVCVGAHFHVSYARDSERYQVVVSTEDHAGETPLHEGEQIRLILLHALRGIGRDLTAGHAIETGSAMVVAWQECGDPDCDGSLE